MRLLITAGPTREYLDPVRYLSNASTGRMGYAIAASAARRGHSVVLISGPVEIAPPQGVTVRSVVSTRQMLEAAVEEFVHCDAAIMAAAVCDFTPAHTAQHKQARKGQLDLHLLPTPDICAHLGAIKGSRIVVGFALEDRDGKTRASAKLREKKCDVIVLNGTGNIGSENGEIQILHASGEWEEICRGSKVELAEKVVQLTETLVAKVGSVRAIS